MMKIDNLREEINEYLKNYFLNKGSYNKIIYEASGYSVNIGGKRIRPILLMLCYSMYNKNFKDVIDMAAAIEMIHTYSLIHDDLPCMDNDDLRRGKPTNHKVFGESMAVLAGDALLNEAMSVMMKFSLEKGGNSLKAAYEISKAAGMNGMIAGQVVDILSEGKEISEDELKYMHENKTGALIKASILAGAILAEAPKEDLKLLESYGAKLGMAFQIKDDILDIVGDAKLLGKNIHADEAQNKTNFITVYGLEKCEKICVSLTKECIDILNKLTVNSTDLADLTLSLLKRQN